MNLTGNKTRCSAYSNTFDVRNAMGFYRVFAGPDGESHIEELNPKRHPEFSSFLYVTEIGIHEFHDLRNKVDPIIKTA